MFASQRNETRCSLTTEMINLYAKVMYCQATDSAETANVLLVKLEVFAQENSGMAPTIREICEGAKAALKTQPSTEVAKMLSIVIEAIQNPEEAQRVALQNSAVAAMVKRDSDEGLFRLGLAMFVLGSMLTIFGALVIAASLGVCATGILAPIATIGLAAGVAICATGAVTASAGLGLAIAQVNKENSISPSHR